MLEPLTVHPNGGYKKIKKMVKNMKENTNENSDNLAAIGIGAMIVFIALILVAAVAAAVIIQTAEQLQQNAQTTGEETTDLLASKVFIKSIVTTGAADPATSIFVTFELAPGSDSITAANVMWAIECGANSNSGDFTTASQVGTAGNAVTLNTGSTYSITLNLAGATNCPPTANTANEFMIQSGSGGFTYELLSYGGSVDRGVVVV